MNQYDGLIHQECVTVPAHVTYSGPGTYRHNPCLYSYTAMHSSERARARIDTEVAHDLRSSSHAASRFGPDPYKRTMSLTTSPPPHAAQHHWNRASPAFSVLGSRHERMAIGAPETPGLLMTVGRSRLGSRA